MEVGTARKNVEPWRSSTHFTSVPDTRRYNNHAKNEDAAIFVVKDSAPSIHRDILLFHKDNKGNEYFISPAVT